MREYVRPWVVTDPPDALLLDWDSVVGCGRVWKRTIIRLCAHFGVEITLEEIELAHGRNEIRCLWAYVQRILLQHEITISVDDVQKLEAVLYYGDSSISGLCAEEGLLVSCETLTTLAESVNGRIAIVTNRPRDRIHAALESTGLSRKCIFRSVVSRSDVGDQLKPHPAGVLEACRRLAVQVSRAIMVDDSPTGIEAAVTAGAMPIGVAAAGNMQLRTSLWRAGASNIIESLDGLLAMIPSRNGKEGS